MNGAWTDATILNVTLTTDESNRSSPEVAAPTQVGNSFCFGPSLNLTWQDGANWDAFRVYDGSRLLKELTASDAQLQRSGPTYYYAVPPPITHAKLGVSAVKSGAESTVTYIDRTVTC